MAQVKVRATHHLPGPAWDKLGEVEIAPADVPGPDVDALIVINEPVDLELYPSLRLIANYSVGYDRIDVAAATARGVAVTNTPGVLDAATADLAMALMLATRRGVVTGDRAVRAGGWAIAPGREVSGATLGIIGLGRIGSAVARRAAGFDMRILPVRRSEGDLDEVLRTADIVTLHVPLSTETRELISRERLALLKDGATLVNTARGAIVDEPALVAELVSGRISAGLDVFAHEPQVPAELYGLDNVVLAPHIGSSTVETRAAMTRVVVDNVLAFLRGEPLPNPVDSVSLAGATGANPLAHFVPVARAERLGEALVRVCRVEHVVFEVAADRDVGERDVADLHERVGRELRLGDRVVLELELGCDLHQVGPVRARSAAHDHVPSRCTSPRPSSAG